MDSIRKEHGDAEPQPESSNRKRPLNVASAITRALSVEATDARPLSGGCVGEVYRVALADGRDAVAKIDRSADAKLDIEGYMLRYLAEQSALPVPEVYHCAPELLVMSYEPGDSQFNTKSERHAADMLGALHALTAPSFGLERDTLIGGLHQPNALSASWVEFFRDHRLRHMAEEAHRAGRLPAPALRGVEALAEKLHDLIGEPKQPALLHGDVWTSNVLAKGDAVTAFIDPAIYYGHPEIELAFISLFHTFGRPFYSHYESHHPIEPGFFEERCDVYNLYPLLVHVRLFGGGYVGSVLRTLERFGC